MAASSVMPKRLNIATRMPAPMVRLSQAAQAPGRGALVSNHVTTPA